MTIKDLFLTFNVEKERINNLKIIRESMGMHKYPRYMEGRILNSWDDNAKRVSHPLCYQIPNQYLTLRRQDLNP